MPNSCLCRKYRKKWTDNVWSSPSTQGGLNSLNRASCLCHANMRSCRICVGMAGQMVWLRCTWDWKGVCSLDSTVSVLCLGSGIQLRGFGRKGNSCAVEFSGSGPILNLGACTLVRPQVVGLCLCCCHKPFQLVEQMCIKKASNNKNLTFK